MSVKKNKSDSYQYRIVEIAVDPSILGDFPFEDGLGAIIDVSGYSEELQDLRHELMDEVRRVIFSSLTKRQAEVLVLRLQGKTQMEIAEELGVCQPTVHKIIHGNIDYKNNEARYGGALKKLRKLCTKDRRIMGVLEKIKVYNGDKGEG